MTEINHAHPHHAELVNPDGSWKFTNALARQTSPYLLQHAHNPVNWFPWGAEAFEIAARENKPVFLSIGYSTCYWCHVMERQSFENPRIARLMNELFVNIKVDREERPDVDDIYMAAVQLMTGHGGWPMSVFLTPPTTSFGGGLKPFFAGTYFPPEPSRGMPSFPQLCQGISNAWTTQRDDVLEQAEKVADAIREHAARSEPPTSPSSEFVQRAANQLVHSYDSEHGGFGHAPKFPQACNLLFLLKVHQNNPNDQLWHALSHTHERMAEGGMYDQIGGGFHRYSTDEKWLIPHFEKMLYDQAQLVECYLLCQTIKPLTDDPTLFARIVRETCDYVLREMVDSSGGFWSAQDAEVDALEGGNYLWQPEQIAEALGPDMSEHAPLMLQLYGLHHGANFQDPHHPDAPSANVLFFPKPLHEFAREHRLGLDELIALKQNADRHLLAARSKRKQPATDDKVLLSWNGMMIASLASAGRQLDEPHYIAAAARAADALLNHLRDPTRPGRLFRTWRKGVAQIPAFLDDYTFFIHGLIQLAHAHGDPRWLKAAIELVAVVRHDFAAPAGGYFDTLDGQSDLFVRTRSTYDGAIPSGNSQMVHDLIDSFELTGKSEYLELAARDLRAMAASMQRLGANMAHMHHALLRVLEQASSLLGSSVAAPVSQKPSVAVDVMPSRIHVGDRPVTLTVTLTIPPGVHLNANNPQADGLIPTRLTLEPSSGITFSVDYPPGVVRRYPFAGESLKVYEGSLTLKATLQRTDRAAEPKRTLLLRYQACTETECLQPQEVELPVVFVPGSDP